MPEDTNQQAYWGANVDPNNLGQQFDPRGFRLSEEMSFYLVPDQRQALRSMSPLKGKRILEIGAGVSVNTLYLAKAGAQVVAIDIAHERLETLRQLASQTLGGEPGAQPPSRAQAGQVFYVKCKAEALPFRDEVCDVVYSKAVLIHTNLDESLPEARRVLKSGGKAVFIEPLTRNPLVNLYRNTLAPRIWKQITRYFSQEELALVGSHFPRMRVSYYYLFSFLAFFWQFGVRSPRLFRLCLAPVQAFDALLLRLFPFLGRYAWFATIVAEK